MQRCPDNPLVRPDMVKPSAPGYRVKGAFNAGAVRYRGEVILLLRVAETCEASLGEMAVPIVTFADDVSHPGALRVAKDDPEIILEDTRGILYKGVNYLSTLSHIRLARSSDGKDFTVDDVPFLFPSTGHFHEGS